MGGMGVSVMRARPMKTEADGRALLLRSVTETDWERQVIEWAKRDGWMVYSIHDSRTQHWQTDSGFPDLTMVRGDRIIFAELKKVGGRLRRSQQFWAAALLGCPGVEWYVWTPSDEDEVREKLA